MWNFLNRRGALFGFDARIALGVFAVVGVVAGVATFAAANHAREVSRENAVKTSMAAFNQYVQDTKVAPTSFNDFFVNPTVAGWSGPYIKGGFESVSSNLWRFDDYRFSIGRGASSPAGAVPEDCTNVVDCYTTLVITSSKTGEMNELDTKFDGTESPTTGLVRLAASGDDSVAYVFMKGSVKAVADIEDEGGGGACGEVEMCGLGEQWDEDTCACVACGKDGCGGEECLEIMLCGFGEYWDDATCACVTGGDCGPPGDCLGCQSWNPISCTCDGPVSCGGGEEEM